MTEKAIADILEKIRARCATLEGAAERPSHGAPAFFVGKKMFAAFANNHHGDGRVALWCLAEPGAQAMLVDADPDLYFVPPYVGPSGWIGVRLDRPRQRIGAVTSILEDAWRSARARPPRKSKPR